MTLTSPRPAWPLATFAALASAVYAVAVFGVVPLLARVPHPEAVAAGLVVDLVVLVPLAYAALVVRVRGWRAATLGPVIALSGLGAWLVLPETHRGLLTVAVPLAEAGLIVATAVALIRLARRGTAGDPYDRIRAATAGLLGDHPGSRAIASEMAVFRYALGRLSAPAPEAGVFPYRRSSGYGAVLAGLGVAAVAELVGGHLLVLHLWGRTAALVHAALSGYALLWLWADWRALGARPIRLGADALHVRCGLRWSACVPLDAIEAVYRVRGPLPTDAPLLDASALKKPQFILDLRWPVEAEGPYGLRRTVRRVAVGVDEPERFLAEMDAALNG